MYQLTRYVNYNILLSSSKAIMTWYNILGFIYEHIKYLYLLQHILILVVAYPIP